MNTERAVLLALGLLVVVGGAGAAVAGGSAGPGETTDVTVDDSLADSNGTVEVLVSLPEPREATDVQSLQEHAGNTQKPLVTFAGRVDGFTVERQFWLTNAVLVTVDTERVSLDTLAAVDGVNALFKPPRVTVGMGAAAGSATGDSPDRQTPAGAAPDSVTAGDYTATYGVEQINATAVWDEYDTQGEGTSIAVLDTGVDPDHPDIDVAKWAQFDQNGNEVDTEPNDGNGHGTHVSGTATGGNASGTHIGVAPAADLYAAKVLSDNGEGGGERILAGMEWAVDENADIISMSLGGEGYFPPFIDAVRNAQDAGTTVVASIGNSGEGTSNSPGNVYDAISAGASDESKDIASFSSGEEIDTLQAWGGAAPPDWPLTYTVPSVAAPGFDVDSAWPGGGYFSLDGTSMAAPHVSGGIALIDSATSAEVSPAEFGTALEETARKPDDWGEPAGERDTRYGSGIIDVLAAAESLETGPNLVVESLEYPGTIAPDETLAVGYTVENTGDKTGTESAVTLLVDGTNETADDVDTNVTVGPGEMVNGTLRLDSVDEQFDHGDTISFTVELADFDDATTGTTEVESEPPEFVISVLQADDVIEGESVAVTAGVENTGGREGTQTVTLDVGGLGNATTEVTVDSGESVERTLAVDTGDGDAGEYTATVASENDTASTDVTVLAPASFTLEVLGIREPVQGANLTATVGVENTGDLADSQTVMLAVPGLGSDAVNLTLGSGESATEQFAVGTQGGDAGEYTATVTTDNDSVSRNTTVHEEGIFTVSVVEVKDRVEGGDLVVTVGVENTDDAEQTREVTLSVPDLGANSTNVTLGAGASSQVDLAVPTQVGDAGPHTARVTGENQTAEWTVEVVLPSVPGADEYPGDLSGDGLYRDLDGDGSFDIFDVQRFFETFDSPEVQNHAWAYDFNENPDGPEVDIFDVQALFEAVP